MSTIDVLSKAELRIAVLSARGCTNREIADQLFVSLNTVKTHVSRVLTKTATRNRAHLVAMLMGDERFRELAFSDVRPLDLANY